MRIIADGERPKAATTASVSLSAPPAEALSTGARSWTTIVRIADHHQPSTWRDLGPLELCLTQRQILAGFRSKQASRLPIAKGRESPDLASLRGASRPAQRRRDLRLAGLGKFFRNDASAALTCPLPST